MNEKVHIIELTDKELLSLLQLVMMYGTGTGEGVSTPVSLRLALADSTSPRLYAQHIRDMDERERRKR